MTVLRTRLYKPIAAPLFMKREKIISQLEQNSHRQLILVVAGAGYGKSVVVSQWLDESEYAYCWISLEQDCNDLRLYLEYLSVSIHQVFPNLIPEFTDTLDGLELPSVESLVKILINELNELPDQLRIVLDDYHLIKNKEIHNFMHQVLTFAPSRLNFVIISRHDPPIKLGALNAYGKIFELRMGDLRFGKDEIIAYSRNFYDQTLTDGIVNSIDNVTEGWILGIRLIFKEIQKGKNILESLDSLTDGKSRLSGFLIDELFADLSDYLKKGLMLASLFDRFNLKLVENICGTVSEERDDEGLKILDELERFISVSMFITPLDNKQEWFRFHHLIQNFLRAQIKKAYPNEVIDQLYQTSSDYFVSAGFLEEAISSALRGNGQAKAVQIMSTHWDQLLLRDQYGRLESWLGMIPTATTETIPDLVIIRTLLYDAQTNYPEVKSHLDTLEVMLDPLDLQSPSSKKIWGEYHALRAGLYYFTGHADRIMNHANKALKLLPQGKSYFQDYALLFKGFALQISKKGDQAIELFKEHQAKVSPNYRLGFMRSHSYLPLIYIYQAKLDPIKSSAQLVFRISREEGTWLSNVMASTLLASIHYLQNDLNKVDPFIQAVEDHRMGGRPMWVAHALLFGVLKDLASGDHEKLQRSTSRVISFLKSTETDHFNDLANSIEIELAIRQNDLERAEELAYQTRFESFPIVFSFYYAQLTRVKLLLMKGDHKSMEKALDYLTRYEEYGRSNNNLNFLLQVHSLLALWHLKRDENMKAVQNLRKSVEMARTGNYIRTFVDLGGEMHRLFGLLLEQEKADDYILRIHHAFERELAPAEQIDSDQRNSYVTVKPEVPLSLKEIEILKLVSQGHQNKEIAEELCISAETVKKYLYYAYNKLGVKNRTSAVSRAVKLNLIPPISV